MHDDFQSGNFRSFMVQFRSGTSSDLNLELNLELSWLQEAQSYRRGRIWRPPLPSRPFKRRVCSSASPPASESPPPGRIGGSNGGTASIFDARSPDDTTGVTRGAVPDSPIG